MILVDASVWIANLRGEDTRELRLLRESPDLSEIGIADEPDFPRGYLAHLAYPFRRPR